MAPKNRKRRSILIKTLLPLTLVSLAVAGAVLFFLNKEMKHDVERLTTNHAHLIARTLEYEMQNHPGTRNLSTAINAQADQNYVMLVAYVEKNGSDEEIRYSSSGEWDNMPLSELEPDSLRRHIYTAFETGEQETQMLPEKYRYYYAAPLEFLPPTEKKPHRGILVIALDATEAAAALNKEMHQQAALLAAAVVALPLIMGLILHILMIAPLRQIVEVVEDRISGNMHTYVDFTRNDELGRLIDALNQLFEKQKSAEQGMRYSSDLVQTVIDNVPGIIFWKDRNLTYLGCNQAFSGVADDNNIDHVIGKKDDALKLTPELAELYARHDKEILQGNAPIVQEEFLLTPDGKARWIEMHKIPLRDDRKRVIGILGLCFDITRRKHVEQEFEQTSKYNRLLFELATRTRLTPGMNITATLRKICSTVVSSLEIERASIWAFSGDKSSIHIQTIEGRAAGDIRPNTSYRVADFSPYYEPILSTRPVIAHNSHSDPQAGLFLDSRLGKYDKHAMMEVPIIVGGAVYGTLCLEMFHYHNWNQQEEQFARSLADIVAMMITNEQYLEISSKTLDQKDFLELILESTNEGVWDWRVQENIISYSSRWKSMLGYSDHDIQDNVESFFALVHPEDKERVADAIHLYLEEREGLYEVAFRMRAKNDKYHWILSRGKSSFDSKGNAVRFVGTHTDITDLKHAEDEVYRQKYLVEKIIENLPVGMFAKDVQNDFRYKIWNRQMERIFDRPAGQMLDLSDYDLFKKKEADYRRFTDQQLLETEAPVEIYEEIQSEWGRHVSVNIKKFAMFGQNHEPEMIIGIVDDITDLMDAQRELEEHRHHLESLVEEQTRDLIAAKEEAEKANQAKSDFLANMSHELRTPMHAIISYSQLGADKIGDAEIEKVRKYFQNINKSGKRLLHLLNDLLDLSKMEAGQMEYHFTQHDMRETIDTIQEEVRSLLDQKSLTLDIVSETTDTTAWFDDNRLMQVIMNLVSNAIKFSPENKTIRIRLTDDLLNDASGVLPALSLSIIDEGVGIPEEELQEIFDKFSQSSRTKTGAGGTGLGLAISREILSAHRGMIWAENNPEGGAKFILVIPRKTPTIS